MWVDAIRPIVYSLGQNFDEWNLSLKIQAVCVGADGEDAPPVSSAWNILMVFMQYNSAAGSKEQIFYLLRLFVPILYYKTHFCDKINNLNLRESKVK